MVSRKSHDSSNFNLIVTYMTFSFLLVTVGKCESDNSTTFKIHLDVQLLANKVYNRETVNRREDFPYQLSLRENGDHICGAVIIGLQSVLTAAHCVVQDNGEHTLPSVLKVVAGGLDSTSSGTQPDEQSLKVLEIFVHPEYHVKKNFYWENDIAYLRVEPMTLNSKVDYIYLPSSSTPVNPEWAKLSGWGKTTGDDDDQVSQYLQWVKVPIIPDYICGAKYQRKQIKEENMICAGGFVNQQGACRGDSGGPLVYKNEGANSNPRGTLIGLVSWQALPCGTDFPGVYTRVSHFVDWVEKIRSQLLPVPQPQPSPTQSLPSQNKYGDWTPRPKYGVRNQPEWLYWSIDM